MTPLERRPRKDTRPAWAARLEIALQHAGYGRDTNLELARLLNVSPRAVSRWKTGRAEPPVEVWVKIRDITGASIDWMVAGKRPPRAIISNVVGGGVVSLERARMVLRCR
jgi:transcriptional regulator with XRE-family HTH domain